MSATLLTFAALAFIGGMLVAAQGPIYARLSEGLGRDPLLAVFLAFATAALVTGAMAFVAGSFRNLTVGTLGGLPLWVWLGGVFGAVHVVISMQSIPVLGVTAFLVIVVTGNLFGAALYDHLGAMGLAARPFSLAKALGLLLVILGVCIVARA
ncbi:DMT family transporter [Aestuariicoccus sp. MJ-SS9]|uniref:DMT family transporter n=1 Tax=Aestuariicoccus sp. MJ-SS9 TaxID=3079855 RepID=UPI00290D0BCC|nr:DMT family transporter [Aestuariicoccus sp. MJ-SS9]MDU8914100.1 DMT family transporter [Aestuariicoccus sp. MJ-SS9]